MWPRFLLSYIYNFILTASKKFSLHCSNKVSDSSIIGNICELNNFLDVCERCNVCLPRIHYVHFPGRAREIIGRHNLVGTMLRCRG